MTDEQRLLEMVLHETGKLVEIDTPIENLKLDSLEFLNLIVEAGRTFDCKIPDAGVIRINRVGDILTEALAARIVQN